MQPIIPAYTAAQLAALAPLTLTDTGVLLVASKTAGDAYGYSGVSYAAQSAGPCALRGSDGREIALVQVGVISGTLYLPPDVAIKLADRFRLTAVHGQVLAEPLLFDVISPPRLLLVQQVVAVQSVTERGAT